MSELFRYGSIWLRADFHLHTKADKEFQYDGPDNFYESSYVQALSDKDIRVGVITNHNKVAKNEFDALRKTASKKDILLLPGVELSVNEGGNKVHLNIVFSESWLEQGQDHINPLLSTMFLGKTPQQYESENGSSDKNLLQVIEVLDAIHRDYFFVFAHVEDINGLWFEVKGGKFLNWQDRRYDEVRVRTLGFQKVRTRDLRKQVQNWLGTWYPAEVEGCDCKSIELIGKGDPCFIKVGAFNFDAVKFALRDHPNRVAKEITKHQRSHLKSARFEGGSLNGLEVSVSPELNTLIGIRGSGKSSILEAIRYGLDIPTGDNAQDAEYKRKLVRHALGSGGKIVLHAVDRFGGEFELRRLLDHQPEVFIGGVQQPGVSIRETIVSKPLYFGQKDLSSSGEGFERDLIEKLLGPEVLEIRKKIEQQKLKVRQSLQRFQKLSDIAERKEEQTQKKQNAEFQLTQYRKYGLEEKMQKQTEFDSDARRLASVRSDTEEFRVALSALLADHEDGLRNQTRYQSKQNSGFLDEFWKVYQTVLAQLDALVAASNELGTVLPKLTAKIAEFSALFGGLKEEFAAVERTVAEELRAAGLPTLRTEEFRNLNKAIDQAKTILEEINKEQAKADEVRKELLGDLGMMNELWHQEFRAVESEMAKINVRHSSLVIKVEFKSNKEAFKVYMKDLLRGSNLRETTISKLVDEFADGIEIFRSREKVDEILGNSTTVFWQYFDNAQEDFLVWRVPDTITIQYKGKELKEHSLGQRASALMLFVLGQKEHDLIMIDQPEDDLDNQTIYQDVIKLVQELKTDTQFFFATHNPNFPVLGDAEMVVACEYQSDKVLVHPGSIDDKVVQERIVNIMEGGEEAFNRRKEIYGIWKPRNSSR